MIHVIQNKVTEKGGADIYTENSNQRHNYIKSIIRYTQMLIRDKNAWWTIDTGGVI